MKLESYRREVRENLANGITQAPGNLETRGGGAGESWGGLGKAFGLMLDVETKRREDADALAVVNANAEYTRRMNEVMYGEGGLAYLGGKDTEGLRGRYTELEKKIREDVYRNAGIQTKRGEELYRKHAEQSLISDDAQILKLEEQGRQQHLKDTISNDMESALERVVGTGSLAAGFAAADRAAALQDPYADAAGMEAVRRKGYTDVAKRGIEAALAAGEYDKVTTMIDEAKDSGLVDADMLSKFDSANKEKKMVVTARDSANTMDEYFAARGIRSWEVTQEQFAEAFDTLSPAAGKPTERDILAALAGHESGGNYDAENHSNDDIGITARGKYQITDQTWAQYAPQAGLSADAPRTPENQEKVALAMITHYYRKYDGDVDKTIASWYAEAAPEWSEEAWNDPELTRGADGTRYPTVREYVEAVKARLKPTESEGQRYERRELAWKAFAAKASESKRQWLENLKTQQRAIEESVEGLPPREQAQRIREMTAGNPDLRDTFRPALRSLDIEGAKVQQWHMGAIQQGIARGEFIDEMSDGEWLTGADKLARIFQKQGLQPTFEQMQSLQNEINDYNAGTGKYAYKNGPTKEAVFGLLGKSMGPSELAKYKETWPGVSVALAKEVVTYRNNNNGNEPPQEWVTRRAAELLVENTVGNHTRAELAHRYGYSDAVDIGGGYRRYYLPDGRYVDVAQSNEEFWLDEIARGQHNNVTF